jgi:23S rRNA (uracil1939-C5)-methyltransferase
MREEILEIERMSIGGAGVGRVHGKVCFVHFSAPGDSLRVKITDEKKSYLNGELLDYIKSSPSRVIPSCPIFGKCGGCNWQHLSYQEQLIQKQSIFTDIMWRSARVESGCVLPIVASPQIEHYRSRIQIKIRYINGKVLLGFYMVKSHYIVELPEICLIANNKINDVLSHLVHLIATLPDPDKIPQVDLAVAEDGKCIGIIHYQGDQIIRLKRIITDNADASKFIDGLFIQKGRKSTIDKIFGIETLSYWIPCEFIKGVPALTMKFSKGGFSQVNYKQNLNLIKIVCEWGNFSGKEKVLDLYCGNGNFTLPVSYLVEHVTGVEEYSTSIDDARRNSLDNGISNADFFISDAASGVQKLIEQGSIFDVVILDPPRIGAPEIVVQIPYLKPDKIIYISCDPSTLARDVAILKKHNYSVEKSLPVDMFPHTYHLESVTLLIHVN